METIINLTGIDLEVGGHTFKATDLTAEATMDSLVVHMTQGIEILEYHVFQDNIPEPQEGTLYIVPNLVLDRMNTISNPEMFRKDLIAVDLESADIGGINEPTRFACFRR